MSINIRQRLLENVILDLTTAFDQDCALKQAQKSSKSDSIFQKVFSAADPSEDNPRDPNKNIISTTSSRIQNCFFCGNKRLPCGDCLARNALCRRCAKISHYAKVCNSRTSATLHSLNSVVMAGSPTDLFAATTPIKINGKKFRALMNTGSTESFIWESLVRLPENNPVSMASTYLISQTSGYCLVNMEVKRQKYFDITLCFLICVLLSFLGKILWGNTKESAWNLMKRDSHLKCMQTDYFSLPTRLFGNLAQNCKPIAVKSRKYSNQDKEFLLLK